MTAGGTGLGFDVVNSGSHSLAPGWRIDYVSLVHRKFCVVGAYVHLLPFVMVAFLH